jgi:hypothetical protein
MRLMWNGEWVDLRFRQYKGTMRPGITLTCVDTGEPYGVPTVNLPGVEFTDRREILVRDSEEWAGSVAILTAAGILEPTGWTVRSGYIDIPVCRLTDLGRTQMENDLR